MKKAVLLTVASMFLLTSCGSDAPAASNPNVPPATSEGNGPNSSGSEGPERSDRGNLVVEVGEPTGYSVDGTRIVDFVVTSLEVDPICTGEMAVAPENGHFVIVTMEVETAPELVNDKNPYFMTDLFDVIAENGTTMNAQPRTTASSNCLSGADMIAGNMGPGEKAVGSVVLDVATPTGVLVLSDWADNENWEWEYPSVKAGA